MNVRRLRDHLTKLCDKGYGDSAVTLYTHEKLEAMSSYCITTESDKARRGYVRLHMHDPYYTHTTRWQHFKRAVSLR